MESNGYFLNKLNDNCLYNGLTNPWEEQDMIENRQYCYWHYKDCGLCPPCRNNLDVFRDKQEIMENKQNKIDKHNDILNRLDGLMKEIFYIKEHLGLN